MRKVVLALAVLAPLLFVAVVPAQSTNVILVMSDDQGWADVGYRGHPTLQTPHLDAMATAGLRFDRWYAGAPVCSPTRGSCLTGRHPARYGIRGANQGHLPKDEPNLAIVLRGAGYRTGHFGKWHLGTLTRTERDSNRGGRPKGADHYAPPWDRGFDICFSTEAKVPTYDPMVTPAAVHGGVGKNQKPGTPYGTFYWTGAGRKVTEGLNGDDSKLIMDRALTFIAGSVGAKKPFFCVVWFHAPHLPVVAGKKHLDLYPDGDVHTRHYHGCISALDDQLGRLRAALRTHGIARDTMLWFCSDNGPEGRTARAPGRAAPLRGRKRSLLEGGVRVPGLLEWPARVSKPRAVATPGSTLDYLPTVIDALGIDYKSEAAGFDGVSLLPVIDGRAEVRARPIPFVHRQARALIGDRWKLVRIGRNQPFALYDIPADPSERKDLAAAEPAVTARMKKHLAAFEASLGARPGGK